MKYNISKSVKKLNKQKNRMNKKTVNYIQGFETDYRYKSKKKKIGRTALRYLNFSNSSNKIKY